MPNIKLTNLASFKAYFADIASRHKQIDGYKWGDKEIIRNDARNDLAERFLWAQPYDNVRYSDNLSDNINKIKTARVSYMIVPNSVLFADEDAAFQFCEGVIEDIITQILKDKRGSDVNGVWTMLVANISSLSSGPVEVIISSTKYMGWELKIDMMDNTNFAYDDSKWNS